MERYKWITWIGLVVILLVSVKMIFDGWVDPVVGVGTLFA
jgi:predicted tellurium resistance membrane protein TerC